MVWALLLFILVLLLYFLGSIEPLICLACALFGLLYFAYTFWQMLKLARQEEDLKANLSLKDLRPFGHVSGLPLIKGQTCFLALDPADDLLILAENYQVKLPRQALIAIIEVRKRQLKPFIRGLQRLASQADSPSASKAQHLLHALKFAVPMAWKGFFLLELRGEHDANLLILRPLWGSRSGEIFDQTVLSPLHLQSDQVLTELSRDSEEKQRDKLKEAGQELSPATAQPFLLPPHTLHKVDLAKPAHIDKEDYYES